MKRPPQLWVVSIGLLCLLHSVLALRATSLIFAKTSTTTSTTEVPAEDESASAASSTSDSPADNQTATRPPLTGNPQIDYIWDPNLPFELNGYNLSDYPFYDRMPENITFKCDGLHDGFYASVPHKCQVYHHCLYGTRYDFLCANFTAFDQKTFICHFASEVDCDNSKNYWHRNDALYQAASTTTVATSTIPITPSPALNPSLRRPSPLAGGAGGLGSLSRRRRPFRRRPVDYYYDDEVDDYEDRPRGRGGDRDRGSDRDTVADDYYDDPPPRSSGSRRRKRPRPYKRPVEYDEYEEYEDERYDRRPARRDEDRRPYRDDDRRYDDRRPPSKNKDRRVEDDDEERRPDDRRKPDDRRRPTDDRRAADDYDRRPYPRKPSRDRYEDDKDDDRRSNDRPRKTEEDKNDRRSFDRPRKQEEDDRRYRPKEPKAPIDDKDDRRSYDRPRKPLVDEERKLDEDDRRYRPKEPKASVDDKDDRRSYDRPRKPPIDEERRYRPRDKEERLRPTEESKILIKPSGTSVYDRPRAPPIIRRPVPKTEREKFDYKPTTVSTKPSHKPEPEDEEYYDDYEEEPKPKPTRKTIESRRRPSIYSRRPVEEENDRSSTTKRSQETRSQERFTSRGSGRYDSGITSKKPPVEEEYADEYEEDKSSMKGESSRERERSSEKPKSTTEENVSREREQRPVIKVVKRPFLPSRGGNPYVARGLQPVGAKALDLTTELIKPADPTTEKPISAEKQIQEESSSAEKKQSEEEIYYDDEEEIKPVTTKRPSFRTGPRTTTQKPEVAENYRNPLDIIENEYDVTLNDALNPTLPNLPIRSVPTGFSSGRDGYLSQSFQRPRLIPVESPVLTAANSDYVYVKQPTASARYNPYVTVQLSNRPPYTTYQ